MSPEAVANSPLLEGAPSDPPRDAYLAERPPLRQLSQTVMLDAPREEVFGFFADAANLDRITPDWLQFRIETALPIEMRREAIIDYRIRLVGIPTRWRTRIEAWEPPGRFVDAQLAGPYRCWWHEHRFESLGDRTRMTDRVLFTPALGRLGRLVAGAWVERRLHQVFSHRSTVIRRLFDPSVREPAA